MNRYREDTPYAFSPPRYSPRWIPLIHAASHLYLRRLYRVKQVQVHGAEHLVQNFANGDSILVAPNHSDHCDPHAMLYVARRHGIQFNFMAARETFAKNRGFNGLLLQRAGCFSIDREGTDMRSIKEAMRILKDGQFALVVFPEGEIYHTNDKLTPLNEGAATLSLKCARSIGRETPDRKAVIIPTALRYRYTEDIAATFDERMTRLEARITWAPQRHLSIVERIYKFAEGALGLKEKEYLDYTLQGRLPARLEKFREILIADEEKRYFGEVSDGHHPFRIRRLRGKIRTILLDGDKPPPGTVAQCYTSLDRIYMAVLLYSYPGTYVRENTSANRIAETLLKLEEDAFGSASITADRRVDITFCDPIDVTAYAAAGPKPAKNAIADVTQRISDAIQGVLEATDEE